MEYLNGIFVIFFLLISAALPSPAHYDKRYEVEWCGTLTSENTSLPLCVSFRHVSWMMPMRTEDGLRMPAARDGFRRIAPRSSWRPRPLIEISDESRYVGSCRRGSPRANG